MTTTEKFMTKKYARVCGILAYALVSIFIINIVGLIIWRNSTDVIITNGFYMAAIGLSVVVPIIIGLILSISSQIFIARLVAYKRAIKEYRKRKYFCLALKCILNDDFEGAKYYYNGFIPTNCDERCYLYGILLHMASKSEDKDRRVKALLRYDDLLTYYNPDKVKF